MSTPRMTGTSSRLLHQAVHGSVWRAEWATDGGRRIHARLDLAMCEKLARMSVGTDRHRWAGEDPVGPLREPLPNGHGPHWLDRLWSLWRIILFGPGPARW